MNWRSRVAALLVWAFAGFYSMPTYGQTMVNAPDVWLWNLPIPVNNERFPSLAIAPTGSPSLIATGGGFKRIDPQTGGVLFADSASLLDTRSVVWVSPTNPKDLIVSGYQNRYGYWSDGSPVWGWGLGCCNVNHTPFAIDLSTGLGFTHVNWDVAGVDLSSGTWSFSVFGVGNFTGYVSISSPTVYYTVGTEGHVKQMNPVTRTINWGYQVSTTQPLREGAIAADGSLVVTTGSSHYGLGSWWPFNPGELARVLPDGTLAWKVPANAHTAPVIGSQGFVFVGTQATAGSVGAIQAYDLNTGNLVWSAPVDPGFAPSDLLVGNDGRVYAVAGDIPLGGAGNGELLAFEQATGTRKLTVTNVPGAFEIILFNGVIYVSGSSISAIPVSATGYDTESPWPVRFHDNQRTGNRTAPLSLGACEARGLPQLDARYAQLSAASNTFAGEIAAARYVGDGSGLYNLDADDLTSGTVDDARLSSNVALRNATNTFSLMQTFNGGLDMAAGTSFNLPNADTNGTQGGWIRSGIRNVLGISGSNATLINASSLGGGAVKFITAGIESNLLMTVQNNGNVGIGTGSPSNRLEVIGNIKISGGGKLVFPDGTMQGTAATAADLTNLDAGNLTTGTVPNGRLSGAYTNAFAFTNTGNEFTGKFTGDGSALTNVNALTLGGQPAGRYARVDMGNDFAATQFFTGRVGVGMVRPLASELFRAEANTDAIAGVFVNNHNLGVNAALFALHTGYGPAVHGRNTQAGGRGGLFETTMSPGNSNTIALEAVAAGVGPAFLARNTSGGPAAVFATGNVGIGTLAPAERLDVVGNGRFSGVVTATNMMAFWAFSPSAAAGAAFAAVNENANGIGALAEARPSSGNTVGLSGIVNSAQGTAGLFNNRAGGNILVGQNNGANVFRVDGAGVVYARRLAPVGADFAESFAVLGQRADYQPGDVMVIDVTGNRRITRSREAYSTIVAGVYSTEPGVLSSPHGDSEKMKTEVPLAVIGVVPCKVSAENGPIQRGDLLVTASLPGHAMKGTDRARMAGAIVGKALEPLAEGTGVILVLVTLQ